MTISLNIGRRVRDAECGDKIEVLDPLRSPTMLFCLSCSVLLVVLPFVQYRLVFTVFPGTFLCISFSFQCACCQGRCPCRRPRDLFTKTQQYRVTSSANLSLISGRSHFPHRHCSIRSGPCFQQAGHWTVDVVCLNSINSTFPILYIASLGSLLKKSCCSNRHG